MALPTTLDDFATASFWDEFFTARDGKAFEWYCEYPALERVLKDRRLRRGAAQCVLHAGCGNSDLCFELYDRAGFDVVVNVDFSPLAIEEMQAKSDQRADAHVRARCAFAVGDCLALPYRSCVFSFVVEKGLHDAMMKDSQSDCRASSAQLFAEFARVLQPGGNLLIVSLAQTHIVDLLEVALQDHVRWQTCFVWTLPDADSPLLPFIFVFQKRVHTHSTAPPPTATLPELTLLLNDKPLAVALFRESIVNAQQAFARKRARAKDGGESGAAGAGAAAAGAGGAGASGSSLPAVKKGATVSRYLCTIDIKPSDVDVDLRAVEAHLRTLALAHVEWLPDPFDLVPIAFGLKKLRGKCVVDANATDGAAVCDELTERLGEAQVQSVDLLSFTPMRV